MRTPDTTPLRLANSAKRERRLRHRSAGRPCERVITPGQINLLAKHILFVTFLAEDEADCHA